MFFKNHFPSAKVNKGHPKSLVSTWELACQKSLVEDDVGMEANK